MQVKRFNKKFTKAWDQMVWQANNGTIFHTRQFLAYQPQDRFIDHSLIFYKKNKPYVLLPAAEVISVPDKMLISHPGASMGSFVVPEDLSIANALELVEALNSYAKNQGFSGVRITLPPTIYNKRQSNYIDFSLLQCGYQYLKREVSSILFLEDSIEENLAKFNPAHRRAVRKAQRMDVDVRQTDDFESFYEILRKNLKTRHGVEPTHTVAELKSLKILFPDHIQLNGAFVKDIMIGGVVNFIANNDVILAFYISHDEDYQEYRPINLLFYEIFRWAISNNYSVFDFGIFTVNEEPNMGLAKFKEKFGASGIFRDTLDYHF